MEEIINKLFNVITDNYIFIYSPPKVGSTTLVTSLRISLDNNYNVIHIHDEIMLSVLTGINGVKIMDIIYFLSNKGKRVYVIDVYRTPIERKMSEYFEKLSPYHFNNTPDNLIKYPIDRLTLRFNKLFPHLENGDHYFNHYRINNPPPFDFVKKYTIQEINCVKYVKLRLCDSSIWSSILTQLFNRDIVVIYEYNTKNKEIGELYEKFKNEYKLPSNYIDLIRCCPYFNFYYTEKERNDYLNLWSKKTSSPFVPYTVTEYKFYMNLCLENQYIHDIQENHYIDNGCFCKHCSKKRREIYLKAKSGEKSFEKIVHKTLINEANYKKIKEISHKLNDLMNVEIHKRKYAPKQFKIKSF